MGSAEWRRATTSADVAGADAMVEALDDECFGTVVADRSGGIRFGGSPFGYPPYDGQGGICRIIEGGGWRGERIFLR